MRIPKASYKPNDQADHTNAIDGQADILFRHDRTAFIWEVKSAATRTPLNRA